MRKAIRSGKSSHAPSHKVMPTNGHPRNGAIRAAGLSHIGLALFFQERCVSIDLLGLYLLPILRIGAANRLIAVDGVVRNSLVIVYFIRGA